MTFKEIMGEARRELKKLEQDGTCDNLDRILKDSLRYIVKLRRESILEVAEHFNKMADRTKDATIREMMDLVAKEIRELAEKPAGA